MDVVMGILRTVVMIGFVAVAILALAALFMIVFGLATGIDRRMSE
jgi:cell division protein FtsX